MKLFSLEDINNEDIEVIEEEEEKLEEKIENAEKEINKDFELANESLNVFLRNTSLAFEIKNRLQDSNFKLTEHSLEGYYLAIKTINNNLGIKKIPAFEDFANRRTFNISLDIALEGVVIDFIKKLWEKIKEFVYMLYSKIKIFFKKVFNFNLDIDTYDKEIEKLMSRIDDSSYTLKDKSEINTKLPQILSDKNASNYTTLDLMRSGVMRINNLQVKNLIESVAYLVDGYEYTNKKIKGYFEDELHELISNTYDNINTMSLALLELKLDSSLNENYIDFLQDKVRILTEQTRNEINTLIAKLINLDNYVKEVILTDLFNRSISKFDIDKEDLPDSAYEKLLDNVEDFNKVKLSAIFSKKELPFNINFFLAFYYEEFVTRVRKLDDSETELKLIGKIDINIAEEKSLNENVKPFLPPLDKKELKDLYITYKKFKENKISVFMNKFEKVLDLINKDIHDLKKHLDTVNEAKINSYMSNFKNAIGVLEHLINLEKSKNREIADTLQELKKGFLGMNELLMIIKDSRNRLTSTILLMLQRYVDIYRVISITLSTSYTELRLELAKYIYNSLKRYSKF